MKVNITVVQNLHPLHDVSESMCWTGNAIDETGVNWFELFGNVCFCIFPKLKPVFFLGRCSSAEQFYTTSAAKSPLNPIVPPEGSETRMFSSE